MSDQLMLPAAAGADPNAQAEAALQRLVAFRNAWPRPADGSGVRADSLLSVLKYLHPLADMVLKLEVGMPKIGYLGGGYLTGNKVTNNDHIIAAFIWDEVNGRLPVDGQKPVHPKRYNRIKEAAYQLLAIATDLDIGVNALQKTGTAATTAWDKGRSMAVVPLTGAEVGKDADVDMDATRDEPLLEFKVGDTVESIPDSRWGTVESIACGEGGCRYGVRFPNGEVAIRTGDQLRASAPLGQPLARTLTSVGKMIFSDLFTPGELKNDIAALNGRVKAFGDDVSGTPTEDPKVLAFRGRFVPWFNQYFEWFASIDGWFSYRLNSTRDRARQYSDELNAWINEWKAMGGKIVSLTAIATPEKDIGGRGRDPRGGGNDLLDTALLVGGLGLGALVLVTALKK